MQSTKPIFTAQIERLSHEGRGIVVADGKTVFINGGLPGETVDYVVTRKRGKFNEGKVVAIQNTAPERVTPPCPHAELCGGCSLQHMSSDQQIALKQTVLLEQLQHFSQLEPEKVLPPLRSPLTGYRHKARLGVRYVRKKQKLLIGFREKDNPRYLADIDSCAVLHPSVGQALPLIANLIEQLSITEAIPQIEVAVADQGPALIIRHLEALTPNDIECIQQFAQQHQFIIYLQAKGYDSIQKLWPDDGDLLLEYHLTTPALRYQFHPADFTQVNPAINQQLVARVLELVGQHPNEDALDLFCGLGNFTLPLATQFRHVVGVEGDTQMVERAKLNAKLNNINNTGFHAADLTRELAQFTWAKRQFAILLLDPPRSGALEICKQLAGFNAKMIIYISCNPATLARDAGELTQHGYRLTQAGVIDMFAHTRHVEAIAVFER